MSWPLSQDFNEAVQNPRIAFSDPELKSGHVTTGPMGLPLPRSGNYADVYQFTDGDGSMWAVKCFTRPTSKGLAARYAAITEHLKQSQLPFSVGFSFLPEGIRIRNQWYPIVKMQWVEGLPINQFVKDSLGRATILENMLALWVRLCRRMRETGMAHCDIQHGNVLLVPSDGDRNTLGLKLVDYDGMYVPALKNQPSGELGHASYQHPERVRTKAYSPDLDRFPHLVVVTALRALLVGGESLWEKYDTGDNLLFTERDFVEPGKSVLMRELWDTGDAFTVGLLAHLVLSCGKPMSQTPWIDNLMPGGQPPVLTPSQERQAAEILGISIPVAVSPTPAAPQRQVQPAPAEAVPTAATKLTPPPLQHSRAAHPAPTVPTAHPVHRATVPALPRPVAPAANVTTPLPTAFAKMPDPPVVMQSSKKSLIIALLVGVSTFIAIATAVFLLVKKTANTPQEQHADSPSATMADASTPPVNDSAVAPTVPQEVQPYWAISLPEPGVAPVARFSRDGRLVFVAPAGRALVKASDAANGRNRATLESLVGDSAVLAPLSDSRVLIGASELVTWNPLTEESATLALPTLTRPITAIRTEKSGKIALVASRQKVTVVDLVEPKDLLTLEMPSANYLAAVITEDGLQVLTVTPKNQLLRTNVRGGLSTEISLPVAGVLAIAAIDPQNRKVILRHGEQDVLAGGVTVFDTSGGGTLPIPGQFALPAAFSHDGRHIYLISKDGIEIYDSSNGMRQRTILVKGAEGARDLDLSPDGHRALLSCGDGQIRLVPLMEGPRKPLVSTLPQPLAKAPPPRPARPDLAELPGRELKRLPVPDAAAQQKAEFEIKEVYKADFARKATADRRKLADKLMKDAISTKDLNDRYIMLIEAKKIASELNEFAMVLRCLDLLEEYAVESTQERMEIFDRVGATVSNVTILRNMAEVAVEQADLFLEKDDYESCLKLLSMAGQWFGRGNSPLMQRDLLGREAQVRKQKEAFDAAKTAFEQFKTDPYDPKANLVLGQLRCFVQGRWTEGIKHLELSGDPKLVALAKLEKDTGASDFDRGEAWDQYARQTSPEERSSARNRATHWLGRALVTSAGLEKSKAEDRLSYRIGNALFRPGILMEVFSLQGGIRKRLGKIEQIIDASGNTYRSLGSAVEIRWTGQLKAPVSGRYRLIAETSDLLKVTLSVGGEERTIMDAKGGQKTYPEATVILSESGRNLTITYKAFTDVKHSVVLKWVKPGAREPEVIPLSAFFWSSADVNKLTEK